MKSSTILRSHNIFPQSFFKYIKPSSKTLINIFPRLYDLYYDLLELVICIYIIDKGYESEKELVFESRNVDFWDEEILSILKNIYQFLTVDKDIEIKIIKKDSKKDYQQTRFQEVSPLDIPVESKICLFSGGMDSTCAILSQIKDGSFIIPIHTLTNNRNLGLLRNLHNYEPFDKMHLFFADLRKINVKNIENDTGNMRGLVYLTNAFILSQIYGVNEIIFPENGPMMINPITSMWLRPTRNAHPYFLEKFTDILKKINPDVKINCMFKNMTKAEVISKERENMLLHQTFSCFSIRQKKHCGNCYACLVRKYSSIAANFNEANDAYIKNIFTKKMKDMSDKDKDFYEAIISYLLIINNKYDFSTNLNIGYIPRSFFADYKRLLKNFSLDMIIGISEEINSVSYNTLNVLGKYSHNEISKLDQGKLKSRREELLLI